MRRSLVALILVLGAVAWPGVAPAARGAACTSAAAATYRHSFGGAGGTMTITAKQPLCSGQAQGFALVSYTVARSGSFIYDRATGKITHTNRSLTLNVAVPPCSAQVTALFGTGVQNEVIGGEPYGSLRPGSPGSRSSGPLTSYASGGTTCAPGGTVTFVSACDGTYTARLTNGDPRLTAVFVSGGRLLRVAPGRSTTLRGAPGHTLTIRASTFTTYVGSWRPPATGCASATTTAPPLAAAPGLPPPAAVPPAAAVPSSAPVATSPTAAEALAAPDAPFTTNPVVAATSAAAAAQQGRGTGSLVAIGIGLLMIVAGAVALTYLIRELRRPT